MHLVHPSKDYVTTVVWEIFVVKKFSYARLCTKIKCTEYFITVPYSRVIRRMRLYPHRKRMCAYKRAAPRNEHRLYSNTYYIAPKQTTPCNIGGA